MTQSFEKNLQKYARLLISKGINVQPGHTVLLSIDVEQAPFARLLVKEAYALGAAEVIVKWSDDVVARETFLHADAERLNNIPQHQVDESLDQLAKRASRLVVRSSAPNAFEGVDPTRLANRQKALNVALHEQRLASQANKISWTVAAAASKQWAALVFPELATSEEQVAALWDQIFKTTRVYEEDPVAAWDAHEARLNEKADFLNSIQFDALHYTAPGTDLTLGLPENHVWESAGSYNAQGEKFIANMPTEEVYTAPDFRRADGYVSSTKPLSHNGVIIEGIRITFKDGQIVEAHADKGAETLTKLITENDGARGLGEVALVPDPSPISQSGIVFFNTLFDENASNHLAIGSAYASSVQGGTEMSQEELKAAGLNRSTTHVDFMIGSAHMNVDGITKDGRTVPIFRNGDWAI